MASSNYTANLGLNNWSASDRPKRADFVSDNQIIDSVLGSHVADTVMHLTAAQKEQALSPFEKFVYAGTDTSQRTINVGFTPKFAVVFKRNTAPIANENGNTVVNFGFAAYGSSGTSGVSISTNGIVITQESTASSGQRVSLNESGCQYVAIAFK